MDCRVAVETLLAYLDCSGYQIHSPSGDRQDSVEDASAGANPGPIADAISHILQCPQCERRVGYLVRALTGDRDDLLTCQECEDLLPEYMRAEEMGEASGARWRAMAFHLETCPHCAAMHAKLGQDEALAWSEQDRKPERYPVPELSFLLSTKGASRVPWRINEWGALVIEFSSELLRSLRPPAFQPAYAAAGLKSGEAQETLVALEETMNDLQVAIRARQMENDPALCTVDVQVTIPGRGGWPNLADTEVVLKRNDEALDTQQTDAFGKVVFEEILTADLARLVFEITPYT